MQSRIFPHLAKWQVCDVLRLPRQRKRKTHYVYNKKSQTK